MVEPQPYPLVYKDAVPSEFTAYVQALIFKKMDQFEDNKAGTNRKFLKMDYVTPEGDRVLYDMKQKLAAHRRRLDPSPYRSRSAGKRHVRINVLVKQPGGCIPLLENVPIAVAEGDAWLNLASQCIHATTPVEGPGFRSAISFGYQIDPKRGDEFYEIHKKWMAGVRKLAA